MREASTVSPDELARITYKWERIRGVFLGCLETIWQPGAMIAVLVALRYFDASDTAKSLIIASKFFGFLLTPFVISLIAKSGFTKTTVMSAIFVASSLILMASSFCQELFWFAAFSMIAQLIFVQYLPLNTQLYATHFTTAQRGHRISTIFLLAVFFGGAGGLVIGEVLDRNMEDFRWVLRFAAIAALICAFCLTRIPSAPLEIKQVGSFRKNLNLIRQDKLFTAMLGAWMLLGLGNLMILPLRMEYIANEAYGINATNRTVLVVMAVIPLGAKLLMTRVLGRLFDKLNLITMRVLMNLVLLSSMLVFFSTTSIPLMAVGMALLGTGMAGGRILWTLWVTKLAPPGQSSAYMSIHMMSTGLRGVLAPFLGYYLLQRLAFMDIALIGAGLSLLGTVLFLPMKQRIQLRTDENLRLEQAG